MKDRAVEYTQYVWVDTNGGGVNEGDEGKGIWLMDFIHIFKIEQRNLL
jgi:hypothetical protein